MIGFPFDSQVTYEADGTPVFDRAVSSAPLRQLIKSMLSNGVLPNPSTNLQVQPGTGMNVIVNPGFAVIEGGLKYEENQRTLAVQASDTTYDRIDSVVLRWNDNTNARICDFYVLEGTPASSPVRPTLNRESAVYEIGLADLFIPANSSAISVARITDTRYEAERCGIISSITEFDSDTIYKQIQADLAEFKEEEQADFTAWFEYIKEQLSEDAAGHLQAQIGAMSELETDEKTELVKAINEVNEKAKNGGKNLVGGEFSEDVAYSTGDYCIYNNVLKKFIADKDAGAWDDSVVEDTTVADELSEQNKNIESCFQSVSDGKALVASAITDKGVETASDATFETMAANINDISTANTSKTVNMSAPNTQSLSFSAKVDKRYIVVISDPGTENSCSLISGATQLTKKTQYRSCSSGLYVHMFLVKATATTVTFNSSKSNSYACISWYQID